MKKFLLLPLGAAALFATGCATSQNHTGNSTYYMGGLVTVSHESFKEPGPLPFVVDTTKWYGDGTPSGASVSLFNDAIEFNHY